MRVLVTGSEGFLGKHICVALRQAGHEVTGLDSMPGAEIVADITKPLAPIPGLDAVVHLAALAAPRECDYDPAKAFTVNVNGTLQVLKMALESGAKKVVFSSSAHVYGVGPKYLPTDETHPLSLGNTYTTTKILGETLCQLYHENHSLSYTTLRLYNAYGPGQAKGYFIPDMLAKAEKGNMVLLGGSTTKDFVYIDDVARAFLLALQTAFVGPINVGTGAETSLQDIARIIANEMGVRLLFPGGCGLSPTDTRMQADTSRAKRVLGWQPTITVEEGLRAILSSQKSAVPA